MLHPEVSNFRVKKNNIMTGVGDSVNSNNISGDLELKHSLRGLNLVAAFLCSLLLR